MQFSCPALILAAGSSSRLGHPKQLVEIEGEPLVGRTARFAVEAGCHPVCVVLGYQATLIRTALRDLPVQIAVNPNWESGMGSSLAYGVEAILAQRAQPSNLLLLVCDQWKLSADFLRSLIQLYNSERRTLTGSEYAGRIGVPAVFSSQFFPELLTLSGDRGARSILERHRDEAGRLIFPDGDKDLDTSEQLPDLTTPIKDNSGR